MKYKVFVLAIPLVGHMNPLVANLKELAANNVQVVVYSTRKFQNIIEENNAEFRQLENIENEPIRIDYQSKNQLHLKLLVAFIIEKQMDMFDKTVVQVTKDIVNDRPDLVLYDDFALYAKLIIRFLSKNRRDPSFLSKILQIKMTEVSEMPKIVAYTTTIPGLPGIFPDDEEMKLVVFDMSLLAKIETLISFAKLIFRTYRIFSAYEMEFKTPLKDLYRTDPEVLLLAFNIPELQPKYEFYDKTKRKFIGASIDMEMRLKDTKNCHIDIDKLIEKCMAEKKKLVYVSLGSIFNTKTDIYEQIINAFNSKDLQDENLQVVIGTGEKSFTKLSELTEKGSLKVSGNIKLVSFAPQLAILQYAKLFLTHCGFNSVKESIYFGVPMICMPLAADQPLIANHIATRLELGVKLDPYSMNEDAIINSVRKIMNDNGYYDRCTKYSEFLKKYDSSKNFSNEVLNCLIEN
jgi:MGT family glycosyltransferase